MPFVFSATTTLVVPDRFFFLLTNIVKRPFAYPKNRVCKDTKYCLSTNYKIDILSNEVRNMSNLYKKRTLMHCLMHQHAFVLCIIRIAQARLLHHFVCVDSITSSDKSCCYQLCNKYTFCLVERLYGCAIRDL